MANTFTVKVAGETKEFETSLRNLNQGMKLLKSEARTLDKSLKVDPSNTKDAAKLFDNLTQQLELTKKRAEEVKANLANIDPKVDLKAFVSASNQLKNLETESIQLEKKLSDTFAKPYELKTDVPKVDEQLSSAIEKPRKVNVDVPKIDGQKVVKPVEDAGAGLSSKLSGFIKSGLSATGGAAASAGKLLVSGFTGPLGTVKNMLHEVVVGGLREIGSSITQNIGSGFSEIVGNMQETQTAANGLKKVMQFKGISGDYDTLSKSLANTAINTNISTKAADKFASVLIGIGKDAKTSAEVVNAAAVANQSFGGSGEAFDSVSLAMGQMASAGKVTADNVNQITDANSALGAALKSQVYENYKKAGGQQNSFNDAMEKGEISVDDFNNALIQVSQKGGQAIQTLPDAMDSLKESIGTKLQPVFDSLTASLARVVGKIADFIMAFNFDPIVAQIQKINFNAFFTNIGAAISGLIPTLQGFASQFSNIFTELTGKPLTLGNVFKAVADIVSQKVSQIIGYASQIGGALQKAFSTVDVHVVTNALTNLWKALKSIADFIVTTLVQAISQLNIGAIIGAINGIIKAVNNVVKVIKSSGINSAIAGIFSAFVNSVAKFVGKVTNNVNKILSAFKSLGKGLSPIFDGLAHMVKGNFSYISDVLGSLVDIIGSVTSAFLKGLGPGVQKFGKAVGPILKDVGGLFKDLGHAMKWVADKVIIPVLIPAFKKLGQVIDKVLGFLGDIISKVHKVGSEVFKKIGTLFGFGSKNGMNIDAQVKNFTSAVNNSTNISNATANITVNGGNSIDTLQLARQVAKLVKAGAV